MRIEEGACLKYRCWVYTHSIIGISSTRMDIILYPKIRSKNKCAKKSSLHTYESTDFSFFIVLVPLIQAWLVLKIYAKSYSQNVLIFKVFPPKKRYEKSVRSEYSFQHRFSVPVALGSAAQAAWKMRRLYFYMYVYYFS